MRFEHKHHKTTRLSTWLEGVKTARLLCVGIGLFLLLGIGSTSWSFPVGKELICHRFSNLKEEGFKLKEIKISAEANHLLHGDHFPITVYADADGDGYGDAEGEASSVCTVRDGFVADNTDCDDTTSEVNPELAEVCDGLDNDCNGQVDEENAEVPLCNAIAGEICDGESGCTDPCPCYGDTAGTVTWDANFNAFICYSTLEGGISVLDVTSTKALVSEGSETTFGIPGFTGPGCAIADTAAMVTQMALSDEEVAACTRSAMAIAEENAVPPCTPLP